MVTVSHPSNAVVQYNDVRHHGGNKHKWRIALIAGVFFTLLSLPYTYSLTNSLTTKINQSFVIIGGNGPTIWGILIHAVVFVILIRLALQFIK